MEVFLLIHKPAVKQLVVSALSTVDGVCCWCWVVLDKLDALLHKDDVAASI